MTEQFALVKESRTLFNNKMTDIIEIGVEMLKGELLYREE